MYLQDLSLEKAIEMSDKGLLMIIECGEDNDTSWHQRANEWKSNYSLLKTKAIHISPERFLAWFKAKYVIECNLGCVNTETQTYEWRYLYGIEIPEINNNIQVDNIEYVYVLTNSAYPDLVKIGMTTINPQHRLKQINGTGTVDVWQLKFALPVKPNTALQIEQQVHKYFQPRRYHAVNENDREMFYISIFEAMDKVRDIGAIFQTGDPILY